MPSLTGILVYNDGGPLYSVGCRTHSSWTRVLYYVQVVLWEDFFYIDSISFKFRFEEKDDNDMLRQMRIVCTKSDRLLRLFHCCFRCFTLSLQFASRPSCLWTLYKKSTHSELRAAFNNVYRHILNCLHGVVDLPVLCMQYII